MPFSFFRIIDVKIGKGDKNEPHLIYLMAMNTDESIEEMILKFMENETDNLDPEGLDMLQFDEFNNKIVINIDLKNCSK